jgi:AraC-like DNA-binding protein
MITIISTLNIGFSIVIALLLFVCYLFFLKSNNKTTKSIVATGLLLLGLTALQLEHLDFVVNQADPLNTLYYRTMLFLVPPMFYFFSRLVLFPNYQLKFYSLIHFLPAVIAFFVEREIAVPIAFIIGTGYCMWLAHIIYGLRNHRKRFEIEFFFFAFFSLLALAVLIFGFSASFIDNAYFYHFYANGITFAYMLVTAALIIYPDLLNEITEAVKLGYSTSTLTNVDIDKQTEQLKQMMQVSKLYQNENLSLSLLAEAMELTPHQLSELINTHYGVSFSQYIREVRVAHAKQLLISEPNSSVLSISLETGFKSQSNFYAAFKDLTGQSPGIYRKTHKA